MTLTVTANSLIVCLVAVIGIGPSARVMGEEALPAWRFNDKDVARLTEPFTDSRITLRLPHGLKKVDREYPPELAKAGVYAYGWTPSGTQPSPKNFSVTLTPFAKPSKEALDKTIKGMKESIEQSFKNVTYGDIKRGQFLGVECRYGTYTAQLSGQQLDCYFLVGIDIAGTFAISAMIPHSEATPDSVRSLQAAMLSFQRVATPDKSKAAPPTASSKVAK
jgi:hypothetical protein